MEFTKKGEGPLTAKVMLIGEAFGVEEEKQNRPFVGKSGKLLDKQLKKLNINRNELYITNLVKMRPPNNRKPTKKEIEHYAPILLAEIEIVKPKLIVTLGQVPTSFILNSTNKISNLINTLYYLEILKSDNYTYVLPVWHPSFILRNKKLEENWGNQLVKIKDFL